MAKGLEKHKQRVSEIQSFGKDLARRAGRKCELCEEPGTLHPFDTDVEAEPSLETLLLLCERCTKLVDGEAQDPRTLRFLEGSAWSEVDIVKTTARTLLRAVDADWARDAAEHLID